MLSSFSESKTKPFQNGMHHFCVTCSARMVLSPLGRCVSMDMTTQLAMMVSMIRYSNGGQLTNQTNIRLKKKLYMNQYSEISGCSMFI